MSGTKVVKVFKNSRKHWVGNGFYVSSLWSPGSSLYKYTNPFLMLDYAAPMRFEPTSERRGVGVHPHRGFETVTFSISGEVEHRDSSGGGGIIYPGDVQWMSASSGVVHDEFHSDNFSRDGGIFSMVQLWVNLPAADKMSAPKYQSVSDNMFSRFKEETHEVKVIAGDYKGISGKCTTHTKMNVYDVTFMEKGEFSYQCNFAQVNTTILLLSGEVEVDGDRYTEEVALAISTGDENYSLRAGKGTRFLVLSAEPIDEAVASYGPFVMNTKEELVEAVEDFNSNRMGKLS